MSHEAIQLYHRLTSYEPPWQNWEKPQDHPLIRQDLKQNDPDTQPPPVKRHRQELETVELPKEWPAVETSAGDALAGVEPPAGRLDLAGLSRILHLSAGVVRTSQRPGRPLFLFRAAGSAGGRFGQELYVAARDVDGLADGVWWYDPQAHALRRVGPPAADGGTTVIVTGVPWRTGWRYAERGYRHLYWDSGTMLSQLLALAATAGLAPRLYTRFPDAQVTEMVGADGVHEFPLELVALGGGEPATRAGGPAERGEVDDEPQEYPLITATQRAGDLDALGDPWPVAPAVEPRSTPPLDEVILTRGSTRLMDRTKSVPRDLLEWPLTAALRGIDVPHFVAVHGVDGVAPGVYRWPGPQHAGQHRHPRRARAHLRGPGAGRRRRVRRDRRPRPRLARRPRLPRGAARRGPRRGPAAPRRLRARHRRFRDDVLRLRDRRAARLAAGGSDVHLRRRPRSTAPSRAASPGSQRR